MKLTVNNALSKNKDKKTTVIETKSKDGKTVEERIETGEMFYCPSCGQPVAAGTDFCNHCHTFIDPETKQIRNNVSDEELNWRLQKGKEAEKGYKRQMVIGAIVAIVGQQLSQSTMILGFLIFVAGLLILASGFMGQYSSKQKFKAQLGQTVIPQLLNEVFDQAEYNRSGHIDEGVVRGTNMHFPFDYNEVYGSDYIKATYRGVGVEMSDITLMETWTRSYIDEDGHSEEEEVNKERFVGQWIICDFGKRLSADLCLAEGGRKKGQVETENPAFNKKYGIYCKDPHEAFYLLTPHMMESILEMDKRAGGDTYLCFAKEGKVHLAVKSGRNNFELDDKLKDTELEATRQQFRGELKYVVDVIDALLGEESLYEPEA